jgi:catechol 2,3-dioxygenase-like lactoylglutathione lyase family enzyme
MQATLEVVILPVSDPDRSLRFYRDQVGFDLDVDYAPAPDFRVIQSTLCLIGYLRPDVPAHKNVT